MKDYIGQVIEVLRRGHEPNPLTVNNAAAELAQLRAALEDAKAIITKANIDNQMSIGEGYGTWSVTGFFQKSIDDWLQKYGGLK